MVFKFFSVNLIHYWRTNPQVCYLANFLSDFRNSLSLNWRWATAINCPSPELLVLTCLSKTVPALLLHQPPRSIKFFCCLNVLLLFH